MTGRTQDAWTAAWTQPMLTPAAAGNPECCLPGCTEPVSALGRPCTGCRTAFGPHLAPSEQPAPEPEVLAAELAARDEEVRQAYHAQRAAVTTQPEPERRRNQTCWLCEEKHTCTTQPAGWECAPRRTVR